MQRLEKNIFPEIGYLPISENEKAATKIAGALMYLANIEKVELNNLRFDGIIKSEIHPSNKEALKLIKIGWEMGKNRFGALKRR